MFVQKMNLGKLEIQYQKSPFLLF